MRISVVHSTIYRYESPVRQNPHTFRLRPREDGAQRLLNYDLRISPAPAGQTECLDQDGNVAIEAWFGSPVHELKVLSSFQIETLRENPFDFLLAGSHLELPLAFQEPVRSAVAPWLENSNGHGTVREFAGAVAENAGWKTMAFLTALNRTLFEAFGYVIRDEGAPHAPEVTLNEHEGSCRDLALLFCAACRTVGIPARFVSGYERAAAFEEKANMHAWAEVYLLGGGWRGYDPSRGLAVSTSHVAVAAAANPRLAAPITGSYSGAVHSKMEFAISMQVEDV
jgi:transglutaminase-like putative cysteine protease